MAFIASGLACSSADLKKAPFLTASTFVEESAKTGSADAQTKEEVLEPVPMPAEPKAPEESVSPPANISGTYLICSEMKAATATSPESVVNCALRDQNTNNKVNIDSSYGFKLWSYQASSANSSLVVSMVELPQSLEWHVAITLKAPSMADMQAEQGGLRFYISVTNSEWCRGAEQRCDRWHGRSGA
jgi:hypothetical protein